MAQTCDRQKCGNDDYICHGHILNGMSDALLDAYQNVSTTKELWDALEARYMTEDATSKRFRVSRSNNLKMVDDKSIFEQLNDMECILNNFKQQNLNMDDVIIVSSIIHKLSPSWKVFKKSLKHKKNDISLQELGNHLQIEEEYHKQDDSKEYNAHMTNINVVEEGQSNKLERNKLKVSING